MDPVEDIIPSNFDSTPKLEYKIIEPTPSIFLKHQIINKKVIFYIQYNDLLDSIDLLEKHIKPKISLRSIDGITLSKCLPFTRESTYVPIIRRIPVDEVSSTLPKTSSINIHILAKSIGF